MFPICSLCVQRAPVVLALFSLEEIKEWIEMIYKSTVVVTLPEGSKTWCQFPQWKRLEPDATPSTLAIIREIEVSILYMYMQKQTESDKVE